MNTLLALTLEVPDWLFSGQYWGGFFTAVVLAFIFICIVASNFKPFG